MTDVKRPAFAHLATLMKDGSPQVTPVWIDYDGERIPFNSALGRVKDKNVRRDPRVAMSIQDPHNPYRYLQIRGRVVSITQDGADQRINKLAREIPGQTRVPLSAARRSARALQSRTRKGQRDGMKPRNVQPYAKWTPF